MTEAKPTGAIKKKRDNKKQKRDNNSWENVIKSLEEIEENGKMNFIETKYREMHSSLLNLTEQLRIYQKQITDLEIVNSNLSRETAKHVINKSKLEDLARELQKQNKEIKDQNSNKLREEEERRKIMASTFTEKLNKLNSLMDENREHSLHLKDENLNMREKLKDLYNQFQEREKHVLNMTNQISLQNKLAEAQFKKLEIEFAAEKEMWAKEKELLIAKYERTEQSNKFLEDNVKSLQNHLESYQNQFNEFENTIKHSNSIYSNFKDDMVKLQKANRELEKDRKQWMERSQNQLDAIVRMTEANEALKHANFYIEKKRSALEKLCRQLQLERMACLQKLKECNVPPPMPEQADSDTPVVLPTLENGMPNLVHSAIQTDFPCVVRRLPIKPPASNQDSRLYIPIEPGQIMKFNIDTEMIHLRYMSVIDNILSQGFRPSNELNNFLNKLRNIGPEDSDITLDLGVVSDGQLAIVANLGVDKFCDKLQINLAVAQQKEGTDATPAEVKEKDTTTASAEPVEKESDSSEATVKEDEVVSDKKGKDLPTLEKQDTSSETPKKNESAETVVIEK